MIVRVAKAGSRQGRVRHPRAPPRGTASPASSRCTPRSPASGATACGSPSTTTPPTPDKTFNLQVLRRARATPESPSPGCRWTPATAGSRRPSSTPGRRSSAVEAARRGRPDPSGTVSKPFARRTARPGRRLDRQDRRRRARVHALRARPRRRAAVRCHRVGAAAGAQAARAARRARQARLRRGRGHRLRPPAPGRRRVRRPRRRRPLRRRVRQRPGPGGLGQPARLRPGGRRGRRGRPARATSSAARPTRPASRRCAASTTSTCWPCPSWRRTRRPRTWSPSSPRPSGCAEERRIFLLVDAPSTWGSVDTARAGHRRLRRASAATTPACTSRTSSSPTRSPGGCAPSRRRARSRVSSRAPTPSAGCGRRRPGREARLAGRPLADRRPDRPRDRAAEPARASTACGRSR